MRRLIVVAVIALAALHARRADACSCGALFGELSPIYRPLPREATLFLWTDPQYLDEPESVEVTMRGEKVPFELEPLVTGARYRVHRLRVHAPAAGELTIKLQRHYDPELTYDVIEDWEPAPPFQIVRAEFQGLPFPWCHAAGWSLAIDGPAPAAYHLQGKLDGHSVDAYIQVRGAASDEDGVPVPRSHELALQISECGTWWLDPDLRLPRQDRGEITHALWTDVVLSRIDVDGTEVVVARGTLDLGATTGTMPTFEAPAWPAPPPTPPPVVAPAPSVTWWPVGAGAGGGLVLGGLGWFGLARRRRPR